MTRVLFFVLAIATILLAVIEPHASSSSIAATTGKLNTVSNDDDTFWNYDFNSQNILTNNVDWAMSLLF